ncbi:MAG: hypothetical protein A3G32_07385 [Deltaproteobacteria bacterium RIFCSPLOWO2_12_FULL_40_28]|nr:MAG: hypothetical protein A3C45_07430 [Deltaproteobacteria bacterium RIFCSPHIGHO2_02_FULL_40_28]OGQ19222.1 MAG: hypothetical protein A3E27_04385 [Deltaproteobacteria bacterium RIFCSPHIGHO2_12_FULL_40_32]OGQ40554.1 MAG: hypothetical protein A3I69_00685 [Deltaproteobacteria bacterium RIFCSPLOWO2_02_FULL_40_36]OGQ53789.1 MAG: hypothetical protein A3G32_07385 [Deltaproteobacteria bacterium RIFCSPLOWO2_12_FULL_40_28]
MKKLIPILFFFISSPVLAWDGNNPNDPSAQLEAIKALQKLGPNRGALKILGLPENLQESSKLTSGQGLTLVSDVENLNKAIADLGAEVTQTKIEVELSSDILFDFDKATIKPEAHESLKKVALIIRAKTAKKVFIGGYTDSKGDDAYNLSLSEKRAMAVKNWFVENEKIMPTFFTTQGFGETQSVAPNTNPDGSDNPEGRTKNRRVEIQIQI